MKKLFDLSREQLKALAEYKDVIETGRFFRRNFWQNEKDMDGIRPNSQIITRYCLEELENTSCLDLPSYNLKQIKEMLVKNRLSGMIQTVFKNDILSVLKNAYPKEFKKRQLTEWMWSSHGIWDNDEYVIEAVQHMILKEGIRRVDLIPKYDWKKRLLKYNIYNVLSRFDWSVYKLFNFVYPGRFHPSDFRYKTKWKTNLRQEVLDNAYRLMDKTFNENQLTREQILLLNCSSFRQLGLISMLLAAFDGNPLKAKEFYLYKTIGNSQNLNFLKTEIKMQKEQLEDSLILNRLKQVSTGKFIYNLHANHSAYSFLKRHAQKRNVTIRDLINQFGYIYKTAREDHAALNPEEIWELRKKRHTYVEIAEKLGSNPTTISLTCKREFGGDPLIPRPINNYITIQEVMDTHHVDHKTIMKLVQENNLENHLTIRNRYLKKSEIIPLVIKYKKNSLQHQALISRYRGGA
ncbi:MAG: hypothetical protein GXY12_05555 [Clostridiaceae bacterium]|jgi:hypothetical protein|nr:hypothetical protein [Clostridiaceae bacterium]